MNYLIVIPARGGSKRLPRKNILPLAGIPLIAHSIRYAQQELPQARIVVSTDDAEIADISRRYGAEVLDRPSELAGDYVTTAAVTAEVSRTLAASGYAYDYMVLLQPTSPLRPEGMLREAVGIIESRQPASLFTATRLDRKLGRIRNNHFLSWNYKIGQRSQDLEPLYFENGLLYITAREKIVGGVIFDSLSFPMVVEHPFASVDIDTKDDFDNAEYLLNKHDYLHHSSACGIHTPPK